MMLLKLWSVNRVKRVILCVKSGPGVIKEIIRKGSERLGLKGVKIVLNSDGSEIIDDDVVNYIKDETFLLLQKDESWNNDFASQPVNMPDEDFLSQYHCLNQTTEDTTLSPTIITIPKISSISSGEIPITSSTITPNTSVFQNATELYPIDLPQMSFTEPDHIILNNEPESKDDNIDSNPQNLNCPILSNNALQISSFGNLEYAWVKYNIPWSKIPKYVIKELETGLRNSSSIKLLIHTIVGDMRQIKTNIPAKAFRKVAEILTDKYSNIFQDRDEDGIVIGTGYSSLASKLEDRNHYLNRPHKRPARSMECNPVKNKRNLMSAKAGCNNWSPLVCSSIDTQSIKSKDEIYAEERDFLNSKKPTLHQLKSKFANILHFERFCDHFKMLTGTDIDIIDSMVTEKYDKLVLFAQQQLKIEVNMNDYSRYGLLNEFDKRLLHLLIIFSTHFHEYLEEFLEYSIFSIGPTAKTVLFYDNDFKEDHRTLTPFIIRQNEKYNVSMDGELVHDEGFVFLRDAFKIAIGLFFVLNCAYTKKFAVTLEFLQQYALKIYPDTGSKVKSLLKSKKKVIALINKITKFELKK